MGLAIETKLKKQTLDYEKGQKGKLKKKISCVQFGTLEVGPHRLHS
jgi:hypothetical protein